MQFSTQTGWSYSMTYSQSGICKVKNNEGCDMELKSVTLYLGKMGSYTVSGWGNTVTGNNQDIPFTISGGGRTASVTVNNTCPKQQGSTGSQGNPNSTRAYTFNFSPSIIMSDGQTISFDATWSNNCVIFKKNAGSCDASEYNPYSPPSTYWVTPRKTIIKATDSMAYDWEITCGTGGTCDWVDLRIYAGNKTWSWGKDNKPSGAIYTERVDNGDWASGAGMVSTTHGNSLSNATKYKAAIWFSDSNYEYVSGDDKPFYTYQKPSLNNSLSIETTPSNANTSNKFTFSGTNNRAWGDDLEQVFQTRYRIKYGSGSYGSWTSIGNVENSWSRTAAEMRSLVPKAYDGQTATLQLERYSPSASWESDNKPTVSFVVYYRPRNGITCPNVSLRKNNSSGGTITKGDLVINDSSLTGIYVSWSYDTTVANAGYCQGYRIRLYNTSGTVVKSYYTTSKYYTIPKADIPKMQDTYIDVTPYFGNDQPSNANSSYAGNYWYYNGTIDKCNFVVMAAKLDKPQITYPVDGSDWINDRFRVCFQLPADPDKGSEVETYHYEDIELQINGNWTVRLTSNPAAKTTTGTCVQSANVFNALDSNLTYQRKIVAAPCLGTSFPTNKSTYTIRVRVKKKYTASKTNWSDWSNTVTITVTKASFTPSRGDIIYASHYNNAKKLIDRVRKTYGVSWNSPPADVIANQTIIYRSQYPYSNWYDRIVATKKQVNDYGTFDSGRNTVKFDNVNDILENFTQYIEYVTAASNENVSTGTGRNYMRIVYDRCNRLI